MFKALKAIAYIHWERMVWRPWGVVALVILVCLVVIVNDQPRGPRDVFPVLLFMTAIVVALIIRAVINATDGCRRALPRAVQASALFCGFAQILVMLATLSFLWIAIDTPLLPLATIVCLLCGSVAYCAIARSAAWIIVFFSFSSLVLPVGGFSARLVLWIYSQPATVPALIIVASLAWTAHSLWQVWTMTEESRCYSAYDSGFNGLKISSPASTQRELTAASALPQGRWAASFFPSSDQVTAAITCGRSANPIIRALRWQVGEHRWYTQLFFAAIVVVPNLLMVLFMFRPAAMPSATPAYMPGYF